MPKPADDKKAEEKLEEETSNITETEEGGVEVAVEEETPEKEIAAKPEITQKPERRQDPITNKVYAHDRILSNVQKSIEELKDMMSRNADRNISHEQEAELDELDKLAQKDWKSAVGKIAEARAKEIITNERKAIENASQQEIEARLMEDNSQAVLSKHAELGDPTSEKAQIFQDILNSNPRWRNLPDGPLLTMYKMEDELRKRGYAIDSAVKANAETERMSRVTATSLPTSRATSASNKIVLTRDQREFCDTNGISYEDYARTLKKSGDREGIAI